MLSKMYWKASVVLCLVAGLAMFVGSARADWIKTYDFDGLDTTKELNGQDNWAIKPGDTFHNNKVGTGGTGWSGKYVKNNTTGSSSGSYRPNNDDWTFSLVNNQDFTFSADLQVYGDDCLEQAAFSKDGSSASNPHVMVAAYTDDFFMWIVGDWNNTCDIPDITETIYRVGIEAEAEGGGLYTLKPYYQNLTDSGSKVYPFSATPIEHIDAYDLTEVNSIRVTLRSYLSTREARVDNITISQVPEPGTLALLATGLIGLLAYAWRKRK